LGKGRHVITKIVLSMKEYKSPGLDGIITEFYQLFGTIYLKYC